MNNAFISRYCFYRTVFCSTNLPISRKFRGTRLLYCDNTHYCIPKNSL